jgi:hypothetical protein
MMFRMGPQAQTAAPPFTATNRTSIEPFHAQNPLFVTHATPPQKCVAIPKGPGAAARCPDTERAAHHLRRRGRKAAPDLPLGANTGSVRQGVVYRVLARPSSGHTLRKWCPFRPAAGSPA